MNKNIISIIVIVVLLGLAIFVLLYQKSDKSPVSGVDIEKSELKLNKIEDETPTIKKEEVLVEEKVVTETPIVKPNNPLKGNIIETQIKEVHITYQNGAFSPSTLTIEKNTKVIWTNKGDIPMKIGSSPYPTHSNLPELVQKKSVPLGGTYSFIFLNTGSYNYQNDSRPSSTGTIMVK